MRTALIVEDNPDLREVLTETVREETEYWPMAAGSCDEALSLMHSQECKPAVCIMDYQLPDCDGITCLHKLHDLGIENMLYCVPIILASANPPRKIEEPGIEVLRKPFDYDRLAELLRESTPR